MMELTNESNLEDLGWSRFFQQQLTVDEAQTQLPVRVVEVHRSGLKVVDSTGTRQVSLGGRWYGGSPEDVPTIGDWLLMNADGGLLRLLDRSSVFKRVAPGGRGEVQLIAANVDTAFLVTSCNDEFNVSRLERYLALALEARVEPVVVLTKSDLVEAPLTYHDAVRTLRGDVSIELINALDPTTLDGLRGWCRRGQTIALLGSSGVGKSTLLNTLAGNEVQETGAIREADARGRHTTSHRSLHLLPQGGLILDSPGMRELQMLDAEAGIAEMFDDIDELASRCRFSDCGHATEPGCAVQAALADGTLDERRLGNYYKLAREEAYNKETVADRHARVRRWSKSVRQHQEQSHKKR